ncbi:hypothetical protein HDU67_005013, partial [Dinochytrium kinnereticum]
MPPKRKEKPEDDQPKRSSTRLATISKANPDKPVPVPKPSAVKKAVATKPRATTEKKAEKEEGTKSEEGDTVKKVEKEVEEVSGVRFAIERQDGCSTYKSQSLRVKKTIEAAYPGSEVEINPRKSRKKAFEVVVFQNGE